MLRPPRRYVFTVTGTGEFPKDMLRYDDAVALTINDQNIIDATFDHNSDVLWNPETKNLRVNNVNLITESHRAPKVKRWESFTWKVTAGPTLKV